MGRITIFSSDKCYHSTRARIELQARGIPFVEIDVMKYPKKRDDMLKLSNLFSLPQVFFNTRHVGGADATIAVLQMWDIDKQKYASALERYQDEIGKYPDPTNPLLAIPEYPPVTDEPSPSRGDNELSVTLPNGMRTSVREEVETLKKILPDGRNAFKLTLYKKSFFGQEGVEALMGEYNVDKKTATDFFQQLRQKQIIHHIAGSGTEPTSRNLFRLQCFQFPAVLNSYRVWTERIDPNPMRLVTSLKSTMSQIEEAGRDATGKVDLVAVTKHKQYSVFEEAVCELQGVNLATMNDNTKIVSSVDHAKHCFCLCCAPCLR
jgi:glutaredoxin 3